MTDLSECSPLDTVVLDLDGTLVDSVYAHVWTWHEAFRDVGLDVPTWRIHRAIGMGKDRLVAAVSSEAVEASVGDDVRQRQAERYEPLSHHLSATPGASDLLAALKAHGLKVALASSGSRDSVVESIVMLGADEWIDGWICGEDSVASKPDPDPVLRAVQAVHGRCAFVVGDATWDMESACESGRPSVGLLTGGVGEAELRAAGAVLVYPDPTALLTSLDHALESLGGVID
ncbi:putative HAD-superfamily hydrolase, subfamily IA [metagenome]|uniref:Putative HAD-superfamily hydrolase, subfamily IA n=1 Tax=metagenome TaxID=256318 RepID=A0A2P2C7J7_9ZZZZ